MNKISRKKLFIMSMVAVALINCIGLRREVVKSDTERNLSQVKFNRHSVVFAAGKNNSVEYSDYVEDTQELVRQSYQNAKEEVAENGTHDESDIAYLTAMDEVRIAQDKLVEDARLAEEARVAEEARIAEELRVAEELKNDTSLKISKYKLSTSNEDMGYKGKVVSVTGRDRDILERLVMGEAGGQGFQGASLVAQCIRDTMVMDGYKSVESVRTSMGYCGSLSKEPNKDVKKAVAFIFDNGGYIVKHRIVYFYAFGTVSSSFHESQDFVVQFGGHRVFDRR